MNYIENKVKFEEKYMKFSLNNFEILPYNTEDLFIGMKFYSKNDIINLCLSFFTSFSLKICEKVDEIFSSMNIVFLEAIDRKDDKVSLLGGNTVYENGSLSLSVVLRHNLYDLFILVHELTHCITILNKKRDIGDDEFSLFSELLPIKIEDELVKFLNGENVPLDDLQKCVMTRKVILNSIVGYLVNNKDNLVLDVDFEFRYLVSLVCKERIKVPLDFAILNYGNVKIDNILDFSGEGGIV